MDEEEVQKAISITTAEYEKLKNEADILESLLRTRFENFFVAYVKLKDVREFVLSRRANIENDIEDFGMLKPVLNYFLEEAES